MSDLQDFEKLVEAAKADIVERHPELSPDNRGIDPNIIINAQAKQLLKANKNAEGHIANHRRDQSKIVGLKAELKAKNARIAELDKALRRIININENYSSPAELMLAIFDIAYEVLTAEVK